MVVSSSSSSSSSSPSPFVFPAPQTPGRTMEEVWKDITLSISTPTLDIATRRPPYYNHAAPAMTGACHSSITDANFKGMILQDFLATPFKSGAAAAADSVQLVEKRSVRRRDEPSLAFRLAQPPRHSSPATVLTLTAGAADIRNTDAVSLGSRSASFSATRGRGCRQHRATAGVHCEPSPAPSSVTMVAARNESGLGSPCPAGVFSFPSVKKRVPEQHPPENPDGADGDRRNRRMIKNRESAARSRARKQAYTNELELEVNHLTEENERLRRQHEELRSKMAAQLSTKRALQRSSTAPF